MTATASIHDLQTAQRAGLPATAPLQAPGALREPTTPGFSSASGWELAQRIAKAFASSDLMPQAYRGNIPNCLIALEIANRTGASPLLVAQNLYIVHGNPGWSSKFLIATFNQCGRFSAMRYEFKRNQAGDATACRAWAIEKATGERLEGSWVTLDMAKAEGWSSKNGSKWKTMPELMLQYRAAAFFVRTYAPELSMGLQTAEEAHDGVYDAPEGSVRTITDMQGAVDVSSAPEVAAPAPAPAASQLTYAELADKIVKAGSQEDAYLVLDTARHLPPDQQADLERLAEQQFAA